MLASYDQELKEIWEAKEKALKRLEELSLKSIKEKPQLEKPNDEQKQWVNKKMHSWEIWG